MKLRLTAAVAAAVLFSAAAFAQTGAQQGDQKFLPGIFGCEATGGKQEVGAVIGGVVGGALGNRIAKNNRTLGTVIGAAVGVGLGSWIGCRMQRSDQEKAQAAAEAAIANGTNQSWSNPETGASGRVSVANVAGGGAANLTGVKFAPGVSLQSSYQAVSGLYSARSTANIRSAPSTRARVTGRLAAGQQVDVLAATGNGSWLLVGQGGLATGYVSAGLLRDAGGNPVQTAATCRIVTEEVTTADAGSSSTQYKACRNASGQWELSNV
jgi:uncharacterized protein YgiM (DUF1202 family)